MPKISLKNTSFDGSLLFDQTSLSLKSDLIASRFKLEFSAEFQAFSIFIDRYPVRCSSCMGSQLAEKLLLFRNISSISMKKVEKDWFLLTADKTSYWIHRQLRQKCDFFAYTEQPASFDYEKQRNSSFGCVTGGIMIPPFVHAAKISLSANVKTINAIQVALGGRESVIYSIQKIEKAFPYGFGLLYNDEAQLGSSLLINKKFVCYKKNREQGVGYRSTNLQIKSVLEQTLKIASEMYNRTIVLVPQGNHFILEPGVLAIPAEELEMYYEEAKKEVEKRQRDSKPRTIICCEYDRATGQVAE